MRLYMLRHAAVYGHWHGGRAHPQYPTCCDSKGIRNVRLFKECMMICVVGLMPLGSTEYCNPLPLGPSDACKDQVLAPDHHGDRSAKQPLPLLVTVHGISFRLASELSLHSFLQIPLQCNYYSANIHLPCE
jgi:hypothetical protein